MIADELAFWYVDAAYANPDVEILNAVEPGLATTGGPLILASSPHARRGVLWEVFKRHHGAGGDPLILVAHGASRTLNPSLPQRVVDRALEKDRTRATAEYLAEFRTDVEGFVALEVVESCVGDHREMLPVAGLTYRAFVDPSGGSEDAMTLAIAHKTTSPDERVIVDAIREVRPPFSPSAVIDDFAALLKSYRVSKVVGDRYGGEFVKEPFRRHSLSYEVCKQPKSDLFRDMLPLLNSGHIILPRHDRLISQIVGLERRVSRAGRDSIDHAPYATTTSPTPLAALSASSPLTALGILSGTTVGTTNSPRMGLESYCRKIGSGKNSDGRHSSGCLTRLGRLLAQLIGLGDPEDLICRGRCRLRSPRDASCRSFSRTFVE